MDTDRPRFPAASAEAPFDRRSEDVGHIVELGHLNLCVPDQSIAILFYVVGLGLTRDPFLNTGVDNAWINVGANQFHLPIGPAQVLGGTVHLVMPDLDGLLARLAQVQPRLAGTHFAFGRDGDHVAVQCPWGNRLRVHAPDASRFGRLRLGMPCVEVEVPLGAAAGIEAFYREVLAAPVRRDAATGAVQVAIGIEQRLLFREMPQARADAGGCHVQITLADFSGVHRRLWQRGLVSEESNRSQYRFERIVDPASGALLFTLEHEVRSMKHPMYARPLVNRNPDSSTARFAAGDETTPWRLPPA